MKTSRRNFLKFAGAASATAVSGGTTGAAATAASIGTSATASVSRLTKTLEALGLARGLPYQAIANIIGPHWGHTPEKILAFAARIKGEIGFLKTEMFRDPYKQHSVGEKIDFSMEMGILGNLRDLPPDIPLLDILSPALLDRLEEMEKKGKGHNRSSVSRATLDHAWEFFQTFCDDTTTPRHLIGQLENYFLRLARHALKHPEHFHATERSTNFNLRFPAKPGDVLARSQLRDIRHTLGNFETKTPELQDLIANLYERSSQMEHKIQMEALPRLKKEWEAHHKRIKDQQLEHKENQKRTFQERLEKADMRGLYTLRLTPAGNGQYTLQIPDAERTPTRVDWLHWLQTIDPANAKPPDIETSHNGMVITVKNPAALKHLKAITPPGQRLEIILPNRRMGADLNAPAPDSL